MKHLRRVCTTIILVFALTGVALADDGVIHPWLVPPPPPPPANAVSIESAETDMLVEITTEIALDLVRGVISLPY
ncbi:MAG: hypothetical protein ACJ74W_19865 [Pyrinomonadaceae bacterium]